MIISPTQTTAGTTTGNTKASDPNTDPAAAQDRFLKLLVAQLNNQDPMNPLDNAQMTSQMAQINTVTGIQQLNQTMASKAAFDLAGSAASVEVQVLDANGKQIGRVEMGALPAGRFNFEWDASQYEGDSAPRFKVVAANGDTAVASTSLAIDKVSAVSMDGGTLQLQLSRGGSTAQQGVKAIL